jgi:hypothetical protein
MNLVGLPLLMVAAIGAVIGVGTGATAFLVGLTGFLRHPLLGFIIMVLGIAVIFPSMLLGRWVFRKLRP